MMAAGTANDILQGKPLENVSRETQQKVPSRITDAWVVQRLPTLSMSGEGVWGPCLLRTVCCGRGLTGQGRAQPRQSAPPSLALHTHPIGSRDYGRHPDLGEEHCASQDRRYLTCLPGSKGLHDCSGYFGSSAENWCRLLANTNYPKEMTRHLLRSALLNDPPHSPGTVLCRPQGSRPDSAGTSRGHL